MMMDEENIGELKDFSQELESLRQEVGRLKTEACVGSAMMEAGVKNVNAVREILEPYINENIGEDGSVAGLKERIGELSKDKNNAFLFRDSSSKYLGAAPGESGSEFAGEEISFDVRLKTARDSGDFLKAIRIKQEAAKEGIILI